MAANNQDLLLLFDRPKEPLFTVKGDSNQVFEVPENYVVSTFLNYINLEHLITFTLTG